jgi:hypothetical protein
VGNTPARKSTRKLAIFAITKTERALLADAGVSLRSGRNHHFGHHHLRAFANFSLARYIIRPGPWYSSISISGIAVLTGCRFANQRRRAAGRVRVLIGRLLLLRLWGSKNWINHNLYLLESVALKYFRSDCPSCSFFSKSLSDLDR